MFIADAAQDNSRATKAAREAAGGWQEGALI